MEVDLNELIENMSDDDRNKIMTFIEENERKQGFFEQVHSLTDKCFDVCMPDAKGSLNKAGEGGQP